MAAKNIHATVEAEYESVESHSEQMRILLFICKTLGVNHSSDNAVVSPFFLFFFKYIRSTIYSTKLNRFSDALRPGLREILQAGFPEQVIIRTQRPKPDSPEILLRLMTSLCTGRNGLLPLPAGGGLLLCAYYHTHCRLS